LKVKIGILLLAALLLSTLFLNKKEPITLLGSKKNQAKKTLNLSKPKELEHKTIQFVQMYSSEIGKIQNDPVASEMKMRAAAQGLTENDLVHLEKIILDISLNQDDRFVALTLLSWSNNFKVASTLVNIAITPIDPILNPNQKADFENILRMSAVEGLSEIPLQSYQRVQYLNQIVAKSELKPIVDRAMRSLWAEQKLAMSAADQDQEALKKLLSPP